MLPTFATASGSNSNRGELSEDEIYEVLSNRRRRFVIHALKRTEEPIEIFELSQYITAWETGVELEEVSSKHRRNVYSTLQRTPLPKLEKERRDRRQRKKLRQATPKLKNLEIYVEVLGSKEIPWSLYYVGFAGVAVSLLIAVMIDTPVFGAFDPFDVGVLTITAFGLSSIVHHIIGKRTRLGNAEKPPELRKYK